ncbi:MAG: 3-oxoacyl-[acyl-carrier-protein] reductase [Candidatus Marinimicrobia bacterium]|nr:3-oxoacyl-[acyl-carrier-protein] reductase [Candidatus Neomarinimicrobiota bacterium]
MNLNLNIKNKIAVVTGASRGIGKAIAQGLFNHGCKLALISRNEADLIKVKAEIGNDSDYIKIYPCDISNFDDVQNIFKSILNDFKTIDILINNAGLTKDNLVLRIKEQDWDMVIDVNLKGCFNTIKAVTKPMLRNKSGRIINISSIVGQIGNPGQVNYSASKAGILGLTKSLAKELGSRSITVNAIAPGYIETDMTDNLSENVKNELYQNIPLNRLGTTDDVTNLVLFLSSEKASYITGQVMNIDGGMVM